MRKKIEIEELRIGDLVKIVWTDASELPHHRMDQDEEDFDTAIHTYGVYAGMRGKRVKQLIIIKEVFPHNKFHSNVIPVQLVVTVYRFVAKAARRRVMTYIKKCLKEGTQRYV